MDTDGTHNPAHGRARTDTLRHLHAHRHTAAKRTTLAKHTHTHHHHTTRTLREAFAIDTQAQRRRLGAHNRRGPGAHSPTLVPNTREQHRHCAQSVFNVDRASRLKLILRFYADCIASRRPRSPPTAPARRRHRVLLSVHSQAQSIVMLRSTTRRPERCTGCLTPLFRACSGRDSRFPAHQSVYVQQQGGVTHE
jgi:hypothetical protein